MSILRSRSSPNKKPKKEEIEKTPSADQPVRVVEKPESGKKVEEVEKAGKEAEKKKAETKSKKAKKEKKVKIPYPYLHFSIAFLFSLALLVGIVSVSQKLIDLAQETERNRGQMIALRERETALLKVGQDLDSVEGEISIIDQSLPNEEGIVRFVRDFRRITQEVSVKTFNFETDQPNFSEVGNPYIDFSAELTGRFDNLKNFLANLVSLPFIVKLQIVDISDVDREESQMVIGARIFVNDPFFQKGEQ
jgi:Tfp pilus assembly protein PilO